MNLLEGVTTATRFARTAEPFEYVVNGTRRFAGPASGKPAIASIACDGWEESSTGDALHKLILVVRGQIEIEGGSGGWLVIPNHMIFVPTQRPFNLRTAPGTILQVAYLSPDDHKWHHNGCWVTQANPLVHELFTVLTEMNERPAGGGATQRQLFKTVSLLCEDWFANPKMLWLPAAKSNEMRAFVGYVSRHLGDVSVAAACEACNVAPRTMQRLSIKEFSFGLKALITEVRMMRARELLAEDTASIEAVAQDVGYCSLSAFTAAFRKESGVSPSEYRQTNKASLQHCRGLG